MANAKGAARPGSYNMRHTGGNRMCACGCGRRFPRATNTNGIEKEYYGQECAKKARAARRKARTHCVKYGELIPDDRKSKNKSTCSKMCQTATVKAVPDSVWFGDGTAGRATVSQRIAYCHQSGCECKHYPEKIGQGCYTGQCYDPGESNIMIYSRAISGVASFVRSGAKAGAE